MKHFMYRSGEKVNKGDIVRYHGELGSIEFVVEGKTGDLALDWYLDKYPEGGFMITAKNFGRVFLSSYDIDEDLLFVSRGKEA